MGINRMACHLSAPDRPGHDWRYAINAGKMAHESGWQPRESFETGIRDCTRWYLEAGFDNLRRCSDRTY